jgi:hypothetical protein
MYALVPVTQLRKRYSLARPSFQFLLGHYNFQKEMNQRIVTSGMDATLQSWIKETLKTLPMVQPIRGVIWEVDGCPAMHVENLEQQGQASEDYAVFRYEAPSRLARERFVLGVAAFVAGFILGRASCHCKA